MGTRTHFPWYFFWKINRLNVGVGLFVGAGLWFIDAGLALRAVPVLVAGQLLSAFFLYRATKPLGRVLDRVARIVAKDLEHKQKLELFYRRDEWSSIEAALAEADGRLDAQFRTIQAENRKFTTLLESINKEILAIDVHSNVLFYNARFERNFIQRRDKLQSGGKLWSVLDIKDARDVFTQALRDEKMQKLKGFAVTVAGQLRYYNLTVNPLPGESTSVGGVVGVFTDVTESRLAEQMRSDFIANVSHEIRTPLTSIKGFTQILSSKKAQLPEELHDFLDRIRHNTERMIALFNDLLQLSVIESKDRMQVEPSSLAEILAHVEATMRTLYHQKPLVLERSLAVDHVLVDPKMFEQVLTNLVDNACKYGGDAPRVTVTSEQVEDRIRIKVSDEGPGIAREHLPRLFERFYRVDSSRDRGTGGTGLGLAIVKHIVSKHKGTITADSDGAHGTCFTIELGA